MSSQGLFSLPPELLPEILVHLDFLSLARCTQVCKSFRKLVFSVAELRYIIELGRDGLVDSRNSDYPSHLDRIHRLLDLRRRWATLSWKSTAKINVWDGCHAYELVGGVFSKAGHNFSTLWLPSQSLQATTSVKTVEGFPGLRDFAMDPTQDLVAFIADDESSTVNSRKVKIHLCSLSELTNHPSARRPLLEFSVEPDVNWGNFMSSVYIQLADDALSVYIWVGRAGSRLITWNWQTGDIIFDLQKDSLPPMNKDFSLISPRAFIITSITWPGSIYVYTFHTGKPEIVAILSLPELANSHVNVHQVTTHSGPICSRNLPGQPLSAALEYNIHVLRAQYSTFEGDVRTYSIYLRNKTFLSFIKNYRPSKGDETLKSPIPWDDWSKGQTRLMLTPAPYNWLRYAYGERVILPFHSLTDSDFGILELFDFSPSGTDMDMDYGPVDGRFVEVVTAETRVHGPDIFANDICTSLPFRRICRAVDGDFMAFMIDQERVIGLKENIPGYELHCFSF